jgi:3'(2'), 5'-bisphosphate nucleotidase
MSYTSERVAAIDAVLKACRLTQEVQQQLVAAAVLEKGDKSPVTVADYGAQAVVGHLLAAEFPGDPMVGEEDAAALREPGNGALANKVYHAVRRILPDLNDAAVLAAIDRGIYGGGRSGRHWTLDPIDGTKGFLRLEQYAVALALVEGGEVVLGVLGCPNLPHDPRDPEGGRGCIMVAVKGQGATWYPLVDGGLGPSTRLRVDDARVPAAARLTESVESGHTDQSESAQIAYRLGINLPTVRMDSQAKYAAVARGDASIYLRLPTRADYVEKIWDHAAGVCIVREAGGQVTDIEGKALDFGLGRGLSANKGVVVTNGHLHDAVLAAVRAAAGH